MRTLQTCRKATLLWLAVACAANGATDQAAPPSAVTAALTSVNPTYVFFPEGAAAKTTVAPQQVPPGVRRDSAAWAARVVRHAWLPADLEARLRAERWTMPRVSPGLYEILTAGYSVGGGSWSLTETGSSLKLLWHNPNITRGDDPGKTAILLAQVLLNVPDEEAPKMQADLREVPGAGPPLFCGRISIPLEPLPKEQYENTLGRDPYWHKQWYHDMFVWLADGYFYVSVVERTGRPPTKLQPRPGVPPRFLPAGGTSGQPGRGDANQ
jgi:hypothetical protein